MMILNRSIRFQFKALIHIAFWAIVVCILTFLFAVGAPNYKMAFNTVMMLLPVHVIYFYLLSNFIIPRYLYTRKFVSLGISFLVLCIASTFLYRLIEILFADPYFYQEYKKYFPDFKWKKLQGSFFEQLFRKEYLIHGLEQSNAIVWGALVIKFFRMWYERKQVALHAELSFLKAQIHPHFLFNTLNNLYALTLNQSPKSPQVVLGLSEILRYMLYECNTEQVSLKRDIEILQSYILLEKLRYEDRLDLNFTISGHITDQKIAPLLMMPLIENAFKHGASEMMEEAWINIDLEVNQEHLKFKVSNGRPANTPADGKIHFGKIGISNVRKRLELIYPQGHSFTIYDEEDLYAAILEIDLAPQAYGSSERINFKNMIPEPASLPFLK